MRAFHTARLAFCMFVLMTITPRASSQSGPGEIGGFIVDDGGAPIVSAHVTVRDLDSPPNTVDFVKGIVPYVESDAKGVFLFAGLKLNHRYKVYAQKQQDGYPDMSLDLFNPKDAGPVAVATSTIHEKVTVRIGPKAARLKWNVTDSVSGNSIPDPTVFFQRKDTMASAGGSSLVGFLVPSDTEIIVGLGASGYRDWYFPGTFDKSTAAPLVLIPGEERVLQVKLQPAAK